MEVLLLLLLFWTLKDWPEEYGNLSMEMGLASVVLGCMDDEAAVADDVEAMNI